MITANTTKLPTFSETIQERYLLEPLGGPKDVFYYLQRFPDEIYSKAPDSHLYKFMRALLGESGTNWIRKNHLQARIMFEELGVDLFDVDRFFGSPLEFGRIVEEQFDQDPYGLIPKDQWEVIKAKNSRYRNRAMDYFNGARAGNTPLGMRLTAKAGLGHDVEIVENYKFLFDAHSDDPLGLRYQGQTKSTEEVIVLPRREVGQDEQQQIWFSGEPELPNGGEWYIIYEGEPSSAWEYTWQYGTRDASGFPSVQVDHKRFLPCDASPDEIRTALEAIPAIGENNVDVTGGPLPTHPVVVTFKGKLGNKDVSQLVCVPRGEHGDLGYYTTNPFFPATDNPVVINVATTIGGRESTDEAVYIPAADQYHLESAIDRIRPQTSIVTLGSAKGLRERQDWGHAFPSSEYVEAVRYVTGNPDVVWLPPDANKPNVFWIESSVEKLAPRILGDLQYHYTGFHNVSAVEASSPAGVVADTILADYAEPLSVTSATEHRLGATSLVNGIYPTEYQGLPGVPRLRYNEEQSWASDPKVSGDEWIILRFPFVKCVNYLMMEVEKIFLTINVEYDAYDGTDEVLWTPVTPVEPYSNFVIPRAEQDSNPWQPMSLTFVNRKSEMIWSRALRITFSRSGNSGENAVKVRNLRVARNVG